MCGFTVWGMLRQCIHVSSSRGVLATCHPLMFMQAPEDSWSVLPTPAPQLPEDLKEVFSCTLPCSVKDFYRWFIRYVNAVHLTALEPSILHFSLACLHTVLFCPPSIICITTKLVFLFISSHLISAYHPCFLSSSSVVNQSSRRTCTLW